ncbi:hypothetical protein G7Y89_g1340 [Cudoniella acicularis]|uniref:Uncharacterized protein n=1 Tax=Cudoniella acicularis TaxID=354080 RepID=A0A8H4RVH2_9HELO|nr:hypothetical protein G7Y89_g1340 [Cudoniella acicularis]
MSDQAQSPPGLILWDAQQLSTIRTLQRSGELNKSTDKSVGGDPSRDWWTQQSIYYPTTLPADVREIPMYCYLTDMVVGYICCDGSLSAEERVSFWPGDFSTPAEPLLTRLPRGPPALTEKGEIIVRPDGNVPLVGSWLLVDAKQMYLQAAIRPGAFDNLPEGCILSNYPWDQDFVDSTRPAESSSQSKDKAQSSSAFSRSAEKQHLQLPGQITSPATPRGNTSSPSSTGKPIPLFHRPGPSAQQSNNASSSASNPPNITTPTPRRSINMPPKSQKPPRDWVPRTRADWEFCLDADKKGKTQKQQRRKGKVFSVEELRAPTRRESCAEKQKAATENASAVSAEKQLSKQSTTVADVLALANALACEIETSLVFDPPNSSADQTGTVDEESQLKDAIRASAQTAIKEAEDQQNGDTELDGESEMGDQSAGPDLVEYPNEFVAPLEAAPEEVEELRRDYIREGKRRE